MPATRILRVYKETSKTGFSLDGLNTMSLPQCYNLENGWRALGKWVHNPQGWGEVGSLRLPRASSRVSPRSSPLPELPQNEGI